jgi:hypothetical protein
VRAELYQRCIPSPASSKQQSRECICHGGLICRNIHHQFHILPKPIRTYIHTVKVCLDYIAQARTGPDLKTKLSFFQETRHAFGRTALVLSGGGALGAFHLVRRRSPLRSGWQQAPTAPYSSRQLLHCRPFLLQSACNFMQRLCLQGIVRGLMEQGLLPRIIAGSSAGAIVGALAAVHTDDELKTMYCNMDSFRLSFFSNNSTLSAMFHLFKKGTLQGVPSSSAHVQASGSCDGAIIQILHALCATLQNITAKATSSRHMRVWQHLAMVMAPQN